MLYRAPCWMYKAAQSCCCVAPTARPVFTLQESLQVFTILCLAWQHIFCACPEFSQDAGAPPGFLANQVLQGNSSQAAQGLLGTAKAPGPLSSLSCTREGMLMAQLVQGLTGPGSPADKVTSILELNALRGVRCQDADFLKAQHLQVSDAAASSCFEYLHGVLQQCICT